MNQQIQNIKDAIAPYRTLLLQHPIYQQLRHLDDLKILMEQHVFAVWDFMALLKALQFGLTSTNAPWTPIGSPKTRRLINEIVLEAIPPKKYSNEWNPKLLTQRVQDTFKISLPIDAWFEEEGVDEEEITKRIKNEVNQKLVDKINKFSLDLFKFAEKRVMLFQIDKDWREHLAAMDMLRGSVNLRAMGGRDPFFEYKKESFDYFDEMLSNQNERVLKALFNIELVNENRKDKIDQKETKKLIVKKIGRNDMCPCGSGKKYKFCHGL